MNDGELKTIYTCGDRGITAPVLVPLLQALITGVFTGIFATVLVGILFPAIPSWKAGGVITTGATLISWLFYRGRWQAIIEDLIGVDINRDGYIGAPTPLNHPEPLRVEVVQDGGRVGEFIDLPFPDKLPELAAGLLAGRQFTVTAWTGAGQLFSRAEFETLRGELVRRGLAVWKNPDAPAQGMELTAAGRAVLKRIATTTPLLALQSM